MILCNCETCWKKFCKQNENDEEFLALTDGGVFRRENWAGIEHG